MFQLIDSNKKIYKNCQTTTKEGVKLKYYLQKCRDSASE